MTTVVLPKPAFLHIWIANTDGDYVPLHLERRCGACEGTGIEYSTAWAEYFAKHPEATTRPVTEWPQPQPVEDEEGPCRECGGRGLQLTNDGRALVEFMRRWQR